MAHYSTYHNHNKTAGWILITESGAHKTAGNRLKSNTGNMTMSNTKKKDTHSFTQDFKKGLFQWVCSEELPTPAQPKKSQAIFK